MKVAEIMQTDLKTVTSGTSVSEAVLVLAESHISALPVIEPRGNLVGVLSTTDILNAAAETASAEEREELFENTMVRELMTARPATIAPEADVKEAAQQMLYLEIHRLFVVDDGRLVGVVSQSDVVRAVALAKI